MSVILGLNTNHSDSSACLVIDGELIGAISEERLGRRIKSSSEFPHNSINRLMTLSGVSLIDLTHIAISRNSNANLYARMRHAILNPLSTRNAVVEYLRRRRLTYDYSLVKLVALSLDQDPLNFKGKINYIEHHLSHIASSYYLSEFDKPTLGFSYDASGDFVSMMLAHCEGNKIKPFRKVYLPNSLGFFYSAVCQHIGFDKFGEEYKVMGLASYGNDVFNKQMNELIKYDEKNLFKLNSKYFRMHNGQASGATNKDGEIVVNNIFTDKVTTLLGKKRFRNEPIKQLQMDLAASSQKHFEKIVINIIKQYENNFQNGSIAMAGGCALNGIVNTSIRKNTNFQSQFIQPASSDDGTALGAAYWCWHNTEKKDKRFVMKHSYWGFEYNYNIKELLRDQEIQVTEYKNIDRLLITVAKLIYEGNIVGWYQGKSEWGPRALGNRSILANPCIIDIKDKINIKIKRRESFRPFAPTILEEDLDTYFLANGPSPYMQHIVEVKNKWRDKFPAITHIDGTARVQTVSQSQNYLYYSLIKEFGRLSGHPILLNTSFNENEPIVETPEQAYACFKRTDMDILVLGNYILKKKNLNVNK
jgi:carbamoyltransferase